MTRGGSSRVKDEASAENLPICQESAMGSRANRVGDVHHVAGAEEGARQELLEGLVERRQREFVCRQGWLVDRVKGEKETGHLR